jgi:hypothetical protein
LAGRQQTLDECKRKVSKEECDTAFARYLSSSGAPFHAVEDPYFKDLLLKVSML